MPMGNLGCLVHLSHSYSYFRVSSLSNLHVSELWEEIGESQENPSVKGWGLLAMKTLPINSKETNYLVDGVSFPQLPKST